ncbi:TPA: hypothetical protein ACK3Q6_004989 [Burkholderia cepacia]|uniref:hypothetical protein n=1 Tax=Burkholderia cepacia TaxID=292 RepID=UPI001CF4D781|nr:hypothetical protein [Burkholderia cepacia]MCA8357623.1 hypothetical protein [Burkholderia cepacia]HDV6370365.1 hypothetical protein [Burkholderia cepacia]
MNTAKRKNKASWIWGAFVSIAVAAGAVISHSKDALEAWDSLVYHRAHIAASIIKVDMQDRRFDEIVVRISNPTNHAESLTEPSVACVSDRAPNVVIPAWQSSDMPQPMPTFPAPKVFPVNLPAGDTVETTVFFLKSPAVEGIRDCRALRFAWINAAQARVLGPTIKLPPGTASLSVFGPSNASSK